MRDVHVFGIVVATGMAGCTQEKASLPEEIPAQIDVSSDTAIAYLSCMADHPPLVNPIVFRAYSVPEGEDYCLDDVYGIRFYFNDELFLANPLGSWEFTGQDGYLSLEPDDGVPRFCSQLDEFRERESEVEYCIQNMFSFSKINLDVKVWDWNSFEATYEGVLENDDVVTGQLSGMWREDINDCD